jgi:cation transport ATPase
MPLGRPGWIVVDAESIRREVAPYIRLSDDERAAQLILACRATAKLVAANDNPVGVLAYRDPLSEESRRTLAALRARYLQDRAVR